MTKYCWSQLHAHMAFSTVLTDDVSGCLECEFDDVFVQVRSGQMKDGEDVLPTRPDVRRLRVDHLSHATNHHVSDGRRLVLFHDRFERSQEFFLEPEIVQNMALETTNSQRKASIEISTEKIQ